MNKNRDTQVTVRVPADFQPSLGEYITLLELTGVDISKADAIIRLAQIGCKSELEMLRESGGSFNG